MNSTGATVSYTFMTIPSVNTLTAAAPRDIRDLVKVQVSSASISFKMLTSTSLAKKRP